MTLKILRSFVAQNDTLCVILVAVPQAESVSSLNSAALPAVAEGLNLCRAQTVSPHIFMLSVAPLSVELL